MDRVIIFDTTLRDGEQSPGAAMSMPEKLRLAGMLDAAGIDVIEAGFPAASEGDYAAVAAIAASLQKAVPAALARATENDIRKAGEALKNAKRGRIHTFIATSALHMEYKLRMAPEQVLEKIDFSVRLAREYTDDVEWSCEDGTRSDPEFLLQAINTAISAGAGTINVPDTLGYAVPDEYFALIAKLRQSATGPAVFSVHCHDDLGLATANSLAGVRAGARQVECTVNGLGERAGNAALEEVIMALRVRNDALPLKTGVDSSHLTALSKAVSEATGFPVAYNKAVVGRNAFAHESGIHQDGMMKHAGTYEIMRPIDVGLQRSSLPLGKLSGRNALAQRLRELNLEPGPDGIDAVFIRFKALADRKKNVYDDDLRALLQAEQAVAAEGALLLLALHVVSGTESEPYARVKVLHSGTEKSAEAVGDGAVDAVFKALQQAVPNDCVLEHYDVSALTAESDAMARVSVRLRVASGADAGRVIVGRGTDLDTCVAGAHAYLNALNRL